MGKWNDEKKKNLFFPFPADEVASANYTYIHTYIIHTYTTNNSYMDRK